MFITEARMFRRNTVSLFLYLVFSNVCYLSMLPVEGQNVYVFVILFRFWWQSDEKASISNCEYFYIFSSPEHKVLKVSFCDDPLSVVHHPSVRPCVGFQNAIFQNLLVWNYKAQSFHIWYIYIASSRGPLPKLFKLCPWGQNWPCPGGHNFTLNYIRKISYDFLSWTSYGNLTKLNRNGPWVVPYQNCSNGSDWLHK